ncbi:ATP-binding protein [Rhodoferax sp. AJA081-3]|uniref:ATP-binding protein n=1 Tax=Rhodoferax sp. AJA081-3 TaxID=2752316 RepID=UPI001ADF938F|nr:ATP-binding protein [Rhodoferax sp. AJA081-3]QTN29024.1 ATP-binding protein [Rhodoferax sp. AJA081-3]
MTKINPFKPNSPVPTAMFAGRINEVVALEKGLYQTKLGQPATILMTGDRGIGKSSLLLFLKAVAVGNIKSPEYENFDFLSIHIPVSDKLDIGTLLKLIERNISREIGKVESIRSFVANTWSFIQRIKVMDSGVSAAEVDSEVELQLDQFSYSLAETCKRIVKPERGENKKDGILFLFDECDNATPLLRIGYFFKTVTEALQRQGCDNVMFVVAGLPDTPEKLSISHESSVRIFTPLKITELSLADRIYVIDKGLEAGNKLNVEQTTISDAAKDQIAALSEGYPHFIQQFAYSAFDHNTDGEISLEDVFDSAFKLGGAIDAIGNSYYASAFNEKIKSDEYRQVLSIMAEKMNSWITKAQIRQSFTGDDSTLTNALQALTTRKIILKNPSKIGEYRLQQRGFALWIRLFGKRNRDKK